MSVTSPTAITVTLARGCPAAKDLAPGRQVNPEGRSAVSDEEWLRGYGYELDTAGRLRTRAATRAAAAARADHGARATATWLETWLAGQPGRCATSDAAVTEAEQDSGK